MTDFAALAALVCSTPMALVFPIDESPVWTSGMSADWVAAGGCADLRRWAAASPILLVVDDATEDPRFADDPMVLSEPFVRFCAAAPVIDSDGVRHGELCVLDTVPRLLTAGQRNGLLLVARRLADQLRQERCLQTLQDRERLLDGMLAHADVLVYAKDLNERFLYANPALEQAVNFPGGLVGRANFEVFTGDWAEEYRYNDAQIAATGRREVFDEEIVHPDGSMHQLRSTKYPLRGRDGRVFAIAGVSTDVSELVAARAAHQAAETRWRSLVEHSSVAVGVVGADGRVVYLNPSGLVLAGAGSAAEVIGRPITDFMPDKAQGLARALVRRILSGGRRLHAHRGTLLRLDQTQVSVEISTSIVSHQGGPAVQVELQDVTVRAAADDALRESERRFHAVFADSPVAMALSDERGLWVDVNDSFCELYGRNRSELLGVSAEEFAHPDDRILIAGSEQGQLASPDGIHRMESRFLLPDGQVRWAWINITATPGPRGESWTLAVVQDLTSRKADEEALRQSEAELAAIAGVARCLQSGADPRPVIVSSMRKLSGAATVAILEAQDADTLIVTASDGDEVATVVHLADPSVTGQVWRTGQRTFVSDVGSYPAGNPPIDAPTATVSAMWEPVIVNGSVQAVLMATWTERLAEPPARAARAMRVVADEAATSLNATRLRKDLELSATTDPLTGSLNRRAWDGRLHDHATAARATGAPLTLALVDLDKFKAFNDTYGHSVGDTLLREFAAAARACLRKNDLFARWGGEEFSIALPDVDPTIAHQVLDRIRLSVPSGQTCSIGYTVWDPHEPIKIGIARADAALYDAKHGGRNQLASRTPPTG